MKPLPCPFCGGADVRAYVYPNAEPDAYCQCKDCTTCGPNGADEAGAIAAWNRRVLSAAQPAQPVNSLGLGIFAWGVSRMADNPKAALVSFRREPTDDELRALHDALRPTSGDVVRLAAPPAQPAQPVDDLAALVRRLARALRKAAPEHDLPAKAMDYLKRKGLEGSPLRAAAPLPEPVAWAGVSAEKLLANTLKPEEIAGPASVQHDRVSELLHWFARFIDGHANPKWFRSHAFELAYFIATGGINRRIDLKEVRDAAFAEGVNATPEERAMLHRLNPEKFAAPPAAAPLPEPVAEPMTPNERFEFESIRADRDHYRKAFDLRRAHDAKDCWYWQGDGEDHLESMGRHMTVVIKAPDLQQMVAAAPLPGELPALEADDVEDFARTVEEFGDTGETMTADSLLMKWANAGLLECTHFQVTPKGQDALDAAHGGEA